MNHKIIHQLEKDLQRIWIPILVMIGDEDNLCVNSAIFMEGNILGAALPAFPQARDTINLE